MFGRKQRKHNYRREPRVDLEDMRDDCIALFLNSGMRQVDITASGGPTPQTISKWLYKETTFPRLDTIRSFLRAMNYDLGIQQGHYARQFQREKMPPKPRKGKKAA